jgi:hypothetical protein
MTQMPRWIGSEPGTLRWDAIANTTELGTAPNSSYTAPVGGGVISGLTALYVPGEDTSVNIGVIVKSEVGVEVCGSGGNLSV